MNRKIDVINYRKQQQAGAYIEHSTLDPRFRRAFKAEIPTLTSELPIGRLAKYSARLRGSFCVMRKDVRQAR